MRLLLPCCQGLAETVLEDMNSRKIQLAKLVESREIQRISGVLSQGFFHIVRRSSYSSNDAVAGVLRSIVCFLAATIKRICTLAVPRLSRLRLGKGI